MIGVKIVYTILSSNSLFHCCLDDLAVPVLDQVYDHEHSENGVEQSPNETEDLCERERERECVCVLYSGTSLIWTPMEQKKVSLLVRCPHFRG